MLSFGFSSCKPVSYTVPAPDTLLTRFYCNDPEAVNFNWGFPGRPDNALCFYPADVFTGTYRFIDSIYFADGKLDSAGSLRQYMLNLVPLSRRQFALYGFCSSDSLRLSADRFFRASLDTTALKGQIFCRQQDTVSGNITRSLEDSTRLSIFFTVVSNMGTATHRGTAYRQ
jgi:hypothetical protein